MSEITKLYKDAGYANTWVHRYNDGYYEHERYYNSYKEMIRNMMEVNNWTLVEAQEVAKKECKKEHPPFTARKQLELIKNISPAYPLNYHTKCFQGYSFEEGLAKCINNLWQDLSEEEKQQVKGILE